MKYGSLGTISHATMRTADLLPRFADALEDLIQQNPEQWLADQRGPRVRDEYLDLVNEAREIDPEAEGALELVTELNDALDTFAPPYAYFGAHPGDGSDYGFWLHEGFDDDFDGLKVASLLWVPVDYVGEVLLQNDHGTLALYKREWQGGALTEVWNIT